MGTVEAIVAILGASATALGCMGSLLWWTYRRGQASGAEKARREADQRTQAQADAKIQALERLVAEMHAELASMQPKRRRLSRPLPQAAGSTQAPSGGWACKRGGEAFGAYLLRSPENARRLLASIDRLEHGGGTQRDLVE